MTATDTHFRPMTLIGAGHGKEVHVVVGSGTTDEEIDNGARPFAVTYSELSAALIANALNEYLAS